MSNSYGDASSENLERYVRFLEESPVQAFGITDYFSFDSYWKVKEAYQRVFPNRTSCRSITRKRSVACIHRFIELRVDVPNIQSAQRSVLAIRDLRHWL